jgi:hypothetical protein
MGFGKKTDSTTNKTLNLDQSYKNIIKPAVIAAGYECVRADEVQTPGIIDKNMYGFLMQADLVIADISTYAPNAIYELGIRHAVRPYSTIIIKEDESKIPFDLSHTRIFSYTHLGDDIGADEAKRCQSILRSMIDVVTDSPQVDSPLYEYITGLEPPQLPKEIYDQIITDLADKENHLFAVAEKAAFLMDEDMEAAAKYWEKAHKLLPTESYYLQQWALSTYKSKKPSESAALTDALAIISQIDPDGNINDPETLGITGAINKNLYLLIKDKVYLDRAQEYYGKGFEMRRDYYNGENYALCLNILSTLTKDDDEITYYKVRAKKVRENIISILTETIESDNFNMLHDRKWILATLANSYFALDNKEKGEKFEGLFFESLDQEWERATYKKNKDLLFQYI